MSTKWHPASTPPLSLQSVMLRFGDNGERDTRGFYVLARGSYYASAEGFFRGQAVHPTHWSEIEETEQ